MHFLWSIICGAIIGAIAGSIMNSKGGFIRNVVIGMVGSSFGGWIAHLIGIYSYGKIFGIIVDIVGACLLIWIGRKIFD